MVNMHNTLKTWLDELEELDITTSTGINEEAQANMVTFGFSDSALKEWGKASVYEFIASCAKLYEKKSKNLNMVFYAWLDELAGQIRLSAVSQCHNALPFGCKLNRTDLNHVVEGIYAGESGLHTTGVLDIWIHNI